MSKEFEQRESPAEIFNLVDSLEKDGFFSIVKYCWKQAKPKIFSLELLASSLIIIYYCKRLSILKRIMILLINYVKLLRVY